MRLSTEGWSWALALPEQSVAWASHPTCNLVCWDDQLCSLYPLSQLGWQQLLHRGRLHEFVNGLAQCPDVYDFSKATGGLERPTSQKVTCEAVWATDATLDDVNLNVFQHATTTAVDLDD